MKYEELIKKAAASGMSLKEFMGFMPNFFRRFTPGVLTNAELEKDLPPSPKSAEPPSSERVMCEEKGAMYAQEQLNLKAEAEKSRQAALEAAKEWKGKEHAVDLQLLDFLRTKSAKALASAILIAVLLSLIGVLAGGEFELLKAVVRDWIGEKGDEGSSLLTISAVLFIPISILAHIALDDSRKKSLRWTTALGLVTLGLLLGVVRGVSNETPGANVMAGYAFWSLLSILAPLCVAFLISPLWTQTKDLLGYLTEIYCFMRLRRIYRRKASDEENNAAKCAEEVEACVAMFTAAYQARVSVGENKNELARASRRGIMADLAEAAIYFLYWVKMGLKPESSSADLDGKSEHADASNRPSSPAYPCNGAKAELKFTPSLAALLVAGTVLLLALLGTMTHAAPPEAAPVPIYWVVVCDRSSSGGGISCSDESVSAAFEAWAIKAMETRKGNFAILIVGRDISDVQTFISILAPRIQDLHPPLSQSRRRWTQKALAELQAKPLPQKERNEAASAIVDAIYAASFRLSGLEGEKRIIVASDLREIDSHHNFEKRVPEPDEFLRWLRSLPSKPDLQGTTLTACGFHTSAPSGSKLSATALIKIRQLWAAVFTYWGVTTPILEECSFN